MKSLIVLLLMVVMLLTLMVVASSAQKPVSLVIWTGFPELEPFYKACAEDYKKEYPNVSVEILSTTLREFEAKLAAAIPTDTGPDIFEVSRYISILYIQPGLLLPNPPDVDSYVKSKIFDDFTVKYITWKGKTYGVPLMDGSIASLYYNKKMFREAGLDPEKPPITFDKVMEYARKLAKYDAAGNLVRSGHSLRLAGAGSGIAEKFRFILHNAGGDTIVETPTGKWHNGYDNEAGRATLKYYIDSVHKYHVDDPKIKHDADAFVTELTAMLLREAWVIGEIKSRAPKLEYGVAPMPKWKRWDTLFQPVQLYVTRTCKNPQVAWDLVKFMTNKKNAEQIVRITGWITKRRDVDWSSLLKETPQFGPFLNPPPKMGFYEDPLIAPYDEIQTRLAERLALTYLDKTLVDNPGGIAKAIREMAAETDKILTKAGLYGTK